MTQIVKNANSNTDTGRTFFFYNFPGAILDNISDKFGQTIRSCMRQYRQKCTTCFEKRVQQRRVIKNNTYIFNVTRLRRSDELFGLVLESVHGVHRSQRSTSSLVRATVHRVESDERTTADSSSVSSLCSRQLSVGTVGSPLASGRKKFLRK